MKNGTILQENSTHKAVLNGVVINIIEKGLEFEDLSFPEVLLYSIPAENEDDLFAIFDRLEEDMRCLRAGY